MLPGSLLAGILAGFPLHWMLYSTLTTFIDPYPELPERILFPFVMATVFVWAGSRIAPEYKFETSIVLFGIWLFLIGGFVFLTMSGVSYMGRKLYFQGGGIGPLMAIVGVFLGLYIIRKENSPSRSTEPSGLPKED